MTLTDPKIERRWLVLTICHNRIRIEGVAIDQLKTQRSATNDNKERKREEIKALE